MVAASSASATTGSGSFVAAPTALRTPQRRTSRRRHRSREDGALDAEVALARVPSAAPASAPDAMRPTRPVGEMRFGVFGSLSPMSSPTADATRTPRPSGVLKTFQSCQEPAVRSGRGSAPSPPSGVALRPPRGCPAQGADQVVLLVLLAHGISCRRRLGRYFVPPSDPRGSARVPRPRSRHEYGPLHEQRHPLRAATARSHSSRHPHPGRPRPHRHLRSSATPTSPTRSAPTRRNPTWRTSSSRP